MFVAVSGKVPSAFESCTEKSVPINVPVLEKFTLKVVACELQNGPKVATSVVIPIVFTTPVPETAINLLGAPADVIVILPVEIPAVNGENLVYNVPPDAGKEVVFPQVVPLALTSKLAGATTFIGEINELDVIVAVLVAEFSFTSVSSNEIEFVLESIEALTMDLTITSFNPIKGEELLPVPRSEAKVIENVLFAAISKSVKVTVFVTGFATVLEALKVQVKAETSPNVEVTVQFGRLESRLTITNAL